MAHQEKQNLANEILEIIKKESDSDKNIFFIIFKVLTDNGERKNYSNNKNGVFFNMMSVETDTLYFLKQTLQDYIKNRQSSVDYELKRADTISEIDKAIYHPRDSSSFIKETMKESVLSTSIKDQDTIISETSVSDNNNSKTQNENEDTKEPKKYKNGNYKKGIYCEKRLKAFKDDGGLACLTLKEKPMKGVYAKIWKSMYSNANNNKVSNKDEEIPVKSRKNSVISEDEDPVVSDYDDHIAETSSIVSYENAAEDDEPDYDKALEIELFGEDSDIDVDDVLDSEKFKN
jgi:hypothetical protein